MEEGPEKEGQTYALGDLCGTEYGSGKHGEYGLYCKYKQMGREKEGRCQWGNAEEEKAPLLSSFNMTMTKSIGPSFTFAQRGLH